MAGSAKAALEPSRQDLCLDNWPIRRLDLLLWDLRYRQGNLIVDPHDPIKCNAVTFTEQLYDRTIAKFDVIYEKSDIRSTGLMYFKNGLLSRVSEPAFIEACSNGTWNSRQFFVDGKRHRLDGPAVLNYHDDTGPSEAWYVDDDLLLYFERYANSHDFMTYIEKHIYYAAHVLQIGVHNGWLSPDKAQAIRLSLELNDRNYC